MRKIDTFDELRDAVEDLRDLVQSMREDGEQDLRTVLHHIDHILDETRRY